jgi:hypothetical protein
VGISAVFVQKDVTPLLGFELVTSRADVRRDAVMVLVLRCAKFSRRYYLYAQTVTADVMVSS